MNDRAAHDLVDKLEILIRAIIRDGLPCKCGARDFGRSVLGPDHCQYCDGTWGGNPPEPPSPPIDSSDEQVKQAKQQLFGFLKEQLR